MATIRHGAPAFERVDDVKVRLVLMVRVWNPGIGSPRAEPMPIEVLQQ